MNDYETALYQSIFSLLSEQRSAGTERREANRHQYRCVQLMAPFDGRSLPTQEQFRHVMCDDISPTGFSFFSDQRPAARQLIIALGKVPLKFYIADVVHANPLQSERGYHYHVGCRFLRRVENEDAGRSSEF